MELVGDNVKDSSVRRAMYLLFLCAGFAYDMVGTDDGYNAIAFWAESIMADSLDLLRKLGVLVVFKCDRVFVAGSSPGWATEQSNGQAS
eukprot:732330-Amorphochlora_amoeboformis.AAC.2